jgi:hypothetical protein
MREHLENERTGVKLAISVSVQIPGVEAAWNSE